MARSFFLEIILLAMRYTATIRIYSQPHVALRDLVKLRSVRVARAVPSLQEGVTAINNEQ